MSGEFREFINRPSYIRTSRNQYAPPPLFQSWGHKNSRGGGGQVGGGVGGVRVDVNGEVTLF